jgi:hypothetical protein
MKSGWEDLEKVSIRHLLKKLDIFEAKQKYVWISQTDFFFNWKKYILKTLLFWSHDSQRQKREFTGERKENPYLFYLLLVL